MCVINSSYPQRSKRCQDILNDPRLSDPAIQKFIVDFKFFAEKLIELCNKNLESNQVYIFYCSNFNAFAISVIFDAFNYFYFRLHMLVQL